jgi:hypothetical protein
VRLLRVCLDADLLRRLPKGLRARITLAAHVAGPTVPDPTDSDWHFKSFPARRAAYAAGDQLFTRTSRTFPRTAVKYGKAGVRGEIGGGVSRATYERYLKVASEIMMRIRPHITWMDYRAVLKECGPADVVYLDPPYLNYGRKTGAYSETLDHREMVDILLNAPFRWVLSEYENEIYRPLTEKFGEPVRITVCKSMNDSNHHGGKRPHAIECIWKNY